MLLIMMKRISIDIPEPVFERLLQRADEQRRHPRDEAAVLVARALRGRGPASGPAQLGAASLVRRIGAAGLSGR